MDNVTQKEPWIMVRSGSKAFLLAREGSSFLLIHVNDALSWEKEEALIRRGSVSAALLREMGLKFDTITGIRGVAMDGLAAGDTVTLYLQKGKKKFMLEDDYSREFMDVLFAGIERFNPPKSKRKKDDWWVAEQDSEMLPKMKRIGWFVNIGTLGCSLAYVITHQWFLIAGCLTFMCGAVWLDIVYPAYFTLVGGAGKKRKYFGRYVDLSWAFFLFMFVMIFDKPVAVLEWRRLLIITVSAAALLFMVLAKFAREFRENKANLFLVALLGMLVSYMLTDKLNQALCFDPPQTQTVQVLDTWQYENSYTCEITDDKGQKYEISISQKTFEQLEAGGKALMLTYPGGLGIPYAEIRPME